MITIELDRLHRTVAAAMVAAPALRFAGNAVHPVNHSRDEQEWLR